MNTLFLRIATYGPVGYYKGSGTLATVATIPLVVLLQHVVPSLWGQVVCIFFGIVSAFFIVQRVLPFFSEEDPSAIVIDEGIGTFIVLSGLKLNFFSVVIGFIAFRCFDIWKPCGIKQLKNYRARGVLC